MATAPVKNKTIKNNDALSGSLNDFHEKIPYCDVPGEALFHNGHPSVANIVEDPAAATEPVPFSLLLPLPLLASSFQDDDKKKRMAGMTTARVASVVEQIESSSSSSSFPSSSSSSTYIDHSLLPSNMMMKDSRKRPYEPPIASTNHMTGINTGLGFGGERNISSSSSSSGLSSSGSRMNIMNSGDEHFGLKCDALAEYCDKNSALPPR